MIKRAVITLSMEQLAQSMRQYAAMGLFDGQRATPYYDGARRFHLESGTVLLFTRDTGHHTSGWWKNPDYERCFHLSLSFWEDIKEGKSRPYEHLLAYAWAKAFYGDWTRYIWEEGSHYRRSHDPEVRHYRVFCDPAWQPIIPRGEVYTREFIEAGWKSWSDRQYDLNQTVSE